jgi:beta-barrel assembly-enhancing protease
MNKFIIQLLTFLCLFFGSWILLSRINFTGHYDFKQIGKSNEEKLSKHMMDYLDETNKRLDSDSIIQRIEKIRDRLCTSNDIDGRAIKLHIYYNKEVNAFALPANHMVIYTGLIDFCKSPEELASVMAHEMVHMEHNHIVKKMTKEVGLSLLITLAGNEKGGEILKELTRTISSTAFDRDMERDADTTAVSYLAKAKIDPVVFANLLFRLSQEHDIPKSFEWISTHPNTKDRTADILKLSSKMKVKAMPILNDSIWNGMKEEIRSSQKEDKED